VLVLHAQSRPRHLAATRQRRSPTAVASASCTELARMCKTLSQKGAFSDSPLVAACPEVYSAGSPIRAPPRRRLPRRLHLPAVLRRHRVRPGAGGRPPGHPLLQHAASRAAGDDRGRRCARAATEPPTCGCRAVGARAALHMLSTAACAGHQWSSLAWIIIFTCGAVVLNAATARPGTTL